MAFSYREFTLGYSGTRQTCVIKGSKLYSVVVVSSTDSYVEVIDLTTETVTATVTLPGSRSWSESVLYGNTIYIAHIGTAAGSDLVIYDTTTDTYTTQNLTGPANGRSWVSMVRWGSLIYMFETLAGHVGIYDTSTASYSEAAIPSRNYSIAVPFTDGDIYLYGRPLSPTYELNVVQYHTISDTYTDHLFTTGNDPSYSILSAVRVGAKIYSAPGGSAGAYAGITTPTGGPTYSEYTAASVSPGVAITLATDVWWVRSGSSTPLARTDTLTDTWTTETVSSVTSRSRFCGVYWNGALYLPATNSTACGVIEGIPIPPAGGGIYVDGAVHF